MRFFVYRDPSSRLGTFAKEIRLLLPTSIRLNRGNMILPILVESAKAGGLSDMVLLHEHRGTPTALTVSHFPHGPTASFSLRKSPRPLTLVFFFPCTHIYRDSGLTRACKCRQRHPARRHTQFLARHSLGKLPTPHFRRLHHKTRPALRPDPQTPVPTPRSKRKSGKSCCYVCFPPPLNCPLKKN